jgi:hypothetical protein
MDAAMSDPIPPSEPTVSGPALPPTSEAVVFGAEPAGAGRRAGRIVGIVLAVAFVLVAGSVAVALFALRGSPESLGRMAPANSDFYLSVNLDPALGQKANLSRLASRFPSLRDTGEIRRTVDDALDGMLREVSPGMSFGRDVEPWLGSQVAVVGRIETGGEVAVLIASKDDQAADAALGKVAKQSGDSWTTSPHGGVTVHVWSGAGPDAPGAYAIVDHAVVIGTSEQVVDDVIDADQGTSPRLTDSASYAKTVAPLPEDRLVLAFVNYPHLVQELSGSGIDAGLFGPVSGGVSLDAYQGFGVALSAQSDGLSLDVAAPLDRSKLSEQDLAAISANRDAGPLIAWVPAKAFAFLASPQLQAKAFLQGLEGTSDVIPGLARELQRLGITGPGGLESHLTGDLVVEGGSGSGAPAGAILLGTDDEAAMQKTLDRMAVRLVPRLFTSSSTSVAYSPAGKLEVVHKKPPPVRWATVTDNGVTIRYVASPTPAPGIQLAYAVTNGMGIVGTSPREVEAVIDTKAGGPSVATAPNFVGAISHGSTQGDVIYVDFRSLFDMVGSESIPGDLKPLRTFIVTTTQTPDLVTERAFLTIG